MQRLPWGDGLPESKFKKGGAWDFLVVQWLRLCVHYRGQGFHPWLVNKGPTCLMVWPKDNKNYV